MYNPDRKDSMKKLLHSFEKSLLMAGIASLVVIIVGLIAGWKSAVLFSNGFFWAGAILIIFGVLSVFGGYGLRADFGVVYSQSAGDMNILERTKLWIADTHQSYGIYLLLLLAGVILILISILVANLF